MNRAVDIINEHCVKIVRIKSFYGLYFTTFDLYTKICRVIPRTQSECGKIGTRKTLRIWTFFTQLNPSPNSLKPSCQKILLLRLSLEIYGPDRLHIVWQENSKKPPTFCLWNTMPYGLFLVTSQCTLTFFLGPFHTGSLSWSFAKVFLNKNFDSVNSSPVCILYWFCYDLWQQLLTGAPRNVNTEKYYNSPGSHPCHNSFLVNLLLEACFFNKQVFFMEILLIWFYQTFEHF